MYKAIILVSLLLMGFAGLAQTDTHKFPHIVVGGMAESTVIGWYGGGYLGVNINKLLHFGAFYEEVLNDDGIDFNKNLKMWGGYGEITLFQEKKVGIHLQLRAGIQNENFVFLIPNLLTEWAMNKWFQLNLSASFRNEYPSIGLLAQFSIPLKK